MKDSNAGHRDFKLTPQRMAIMDYLKDNKDHPTAEDIYKALKGNYPTLSFATVYNTLEVLSKNGLVAELSIDPKKKHYDPDMSNHQHIICTSCGKIVDVHVDYSRDLILPREVIKAFAVTDSRVDFRGVCKSCRN